MVISCIKEKIGFHNFSTFRINKKHIDMEMGETLLKKYFIQKYIYICVLPSLVL